MQTTRSTSVSLMPPYVGLRSPKIHLLFQVLILFTPSLETVVKPRASSLTVEIVLFRKDERQERKKESHIFFPLHSRSYRVTTTLLLERTKQNSLVFLLDWLNLAAFFPNLVHRTPLTNTNMNLSFITKGQGRAIKIHYLQEIGGFFYKFCAR